MVLIILLLDVLSTFSAFLFAYFLRNKGVFRVFLDSVQPIETYLTALPAALFLLIITFLLADLYQPKRRLTAFIEIYNLFKAITVWMLFIMAGSYLTKYDYSRIIVVLFYIFTLIFVITGRILIRNIQAFLLPKGFGVTNILIVGSGKYGREIARRLDKYRTAGYKLIGFIDTVAPLKGIILGRLSSLNKIIKKYNVQEVYFADPTLSYHKILTTISKCSVNGTKFKVCSNIFDVLTGNVDIADLEKIPSLDLSRQIRPWYKQICKRLFDLITAFFLLVATFPIWLLIIILIKLESPGKAFFIQDRVGLNGLIFKMYKFRTMHENTPIFKKSPKNNADKRITRIGKLLRKTSLDELPQLINIIKGEMSMVGPRPEMPYIVKKYNLWQKRRLLAKPGLTGLWQILGRKDLPLIENLEYDFYYINNQSFFLDLTILLKTIPVLMLGKGAY